jgi:hypothetical protein
MAITRAFLNGVSVGKGVTIVATDANTETEHANRKCYLG